jgi:hypothetical protein
MAGAQARAAQRGSVDLLLNGRCCDVVLIELNKRSDLELTLRRRGVTLKVTFVPERNEARWEMEKESGFELIAEPMLDWLQLS